MESREQDNTNFKVRMEIYDEGNRAHLFESGCHIKLAWARVGSNEWRQFGSAYYSHCDQIPQDHVRFIDDKKAYVFLQWWYMVTTDEGVTWSSWDVAKHLPGKAYYNPRLIHDAFVRPDGTGTMTLNPEAVRGKESLALSTQDFGLHWTEQ